MRRISTTATIIFNYLETENIASLALIIVANFVTLKTRNIHYLFNKRIISLGDIIINDSVLKYELSIDKKNENNDLFIIISEGNKR